jgi:hypothetical protein
MYDACILQGFNNDVRDQLAHCIQAPAVTIPATICIQLQAWACIGMRRLGSACAGSAQSSRVSALADGLGAGLELVEDFHGARVIGRYYSGWHLIKSRAEMFVGFWQAILLQ